MLFLDARPQAGKEWSRSRMRPGKDYRIGTLRYNWSMSAHASQDFSTSTVPIREIYRDRHCQEITDKHTDQH